MTDEVSSIFDSTILAQIETEQLSTEQIIERSGLAATPALCRRVATELTNRGFESTLRRKPFSGAIIRVWTNPAGEARAWTCFHCGDTFKDERCARLHFGRDETSEAACVIKAGAEGSLLRALRNAEEEADDAIQRMQNESTDLAKAYHNQRCRHDQALIAAEELGYERGLADGRGLSAPMPSKDAMQEDIRLERAKLIAAFPGPVVSFDVREPYYLASCDACGWVGSSQHCGTDTGGDDSDVYCPRCSASGADCGKVASCIAPRLDRESGEIVQGQLVPLADCPIGLFWCGDELCLKTEYGTNEGRIDAYIVSSGEFFWGPQPQSIANQRACLVRPAEYPAKPTLSEAAARELLNWFSHRPRLSLHYYSPVYGDDDDQSTEWRVMRESGSINDREWEIVGRGQTILEAMQAAFVALAQQNIFPAQDVERRP